MNFNMDQSLGFVLNKTAIASKNSFNQKIKSFGISAEQWSVIYRVYENDGISQIEVAKSTYKDQGNLTRMIDKLVQKELLLKKTDKKDRRSINLYMTEKSQDIVKKIIPLSQDHNNNLTKELGEDEKQLLIKLLDKVYTNLQ